MSTLLLLHSIAPHPTSQDSLIKVCNLSAPLLGQNTNKNKIMKKFPWKDVSKRLNKNIRKNNLF